MLARDQLNLLICTLAEWDRDTLQREFLSYRSRFPVDVTPDFLRQMTVDHLRHVFLALCLQNGRLPDGVEDPAAVAA